MKKQLFLFSFLTISVCLHAQFVSNFESFSLTPNSVLNGTGKTIASNFASGDFTFPISYSTSFGGFWSSGWAYSTIKNDTQAGFGNMYASYANGGYNSDKYAIGQNNAIIKLATNDTVKGLYVTNTTYAALSMLNGDAFSKKFGGNTGNDSDYFYLVIRGYANGNTINDSVVFYLADYRFANNSQDYIVKNWAWVNLSTLGKVDSLHFSMVTSDVGQFGPNTPLFFAVDDIATNASTADFENLTIAANKYWNKPNGKVFENYISGAASFYSEFTTSAFGDYWSNGFAISNHKDVSLDSNTVNYSKLYTAVTGSGVDTSSNYAIAQNNSKIIIDNTTSEKVASGVYITNSNYAYLSMKWGDGFAKQFTDTDFFKVKIIGYYGGNITDSVFAYLADSGKILTQWKWVDLTRLGKIDSIEFSLSSSDNGLYGMNTPAFFAIDNFTVTPQTGLANLATVLDVEIYPNPATTLFNIHLPQLLNTAQVTIFDLSGRVVVEQNVGKFSAIEIAHLPQGLYLVKVSSDEGNAFGRIIKQ
ncbi:MAG: DUF4465 domain-containing protein [Bacteroidia bacterium]|nr:DUF4465 domain-containing protein [Bacteroidia bacterium]